MPKTIKKDYDKLSAKTQKLLSSMLEAYYEEQVAVHNLVRGQPLPHKLAPNISALAEKNGISLPLSPTPSRIRHWSSKKYPHSKRKFRDAMHLCRLRSSNGHTLRVEEVKDAALALISPDYSGEPFLTSWHSAAAPSLPLRTLQRLIETDIVIQERFSSIGIRPQGSRGVASAMQALNLRHNGNHANGKALNPGSGNGQAKDARPASIAQANNCKAKEWRHTDFAIALLLPHVDKHDLKLIWQAIHATNGSKEARDKNHTRMHVYVFFIEKGILFDTLLRQARRKGTRLNDFCVRHSINLANQHADFSNICSGDFQSLTGSSWARNWTAPNVTLVSQKLRY